MGRRQKRKRERLARQRGGWQPADSTPAWEERWVDPREFLLRMGHGLVEAGGARTCGGCREFVEDETTGRGECLHPGSGILAPWNDTPGCDFFTRRR
jgi:hypothetical protein